MKVLKFGGASLSSASKIKEVASLIQKEKGNIVVLSAFEGMLDTLIEIIDYLYKKNSDGANEIINRTENSYISLISEIYTTKDYKKLAGDVLKEHFNVIRTYTKDLFTLFEEKVILVQGELISSSLMYLLLREQKVNVVLIPALDFMRTDKNMDPNPMYIKQKLQKQLDAHPNISIYITQGYICRNSYGEIDNFERGGSDLTASLIGAAVEAEEIQIWWTDINGIQNNDPNYVKNTLPIHHLQFEEAAELAYFGAKILHPTCILPAELNNIPVRLLDTSCPDAPGTLISNKVEKGKIKAIAAKDGITAIKIKSGRMLLAHGFLRKVFEVFENYQTPIDMITTSEVCISVTIDNTKNLPEILDDLKKYGTVSIDKDMTIISVIGDLEWSNVGFESKLMDAIKNIPIRMLSYGGSNYNISFLIQEENKKHVLQVLNDNLF